MRRNSEINDDDDSQSYTAASECPRQQCCCWDETEAAGESSSSSPQQVQQEGDGQGTYCVYRHHRVDMLLIFLVCVILSLATFMWNNNHTTSKSTLLSRKIENPSPPAAPSRSRNSSTTNDQLGTGACQRNCPLHQRHTTTTTAPHNIIYYQDPGAGLGDRKVIIKGLAQLAGFLCAELVLPPPNILLNPLHNHGKQVEPDVTWSDYFNFTYILDGSTVISTKLPEDLGMMMKWMDTTLSPLSDEPVFNMSHPMYKDYLHVVSTHGKALDDFQMILHYSFQQTAQEMTPDTAGFVWEIHGHYYTSDLWTKDFPHIIWNATTSFKQSSVGQEPPSLSTRTEKTTSAQRNATASSLLTPPAINRFFRLNRKTAKALEEKHHSFCTYTNEEFKPSHVELLQNRLIRLIEQHATKLAAQKVTTVNKKNLPHEDLSKNLSSSQLQSHPPILYVTLHVRRGDTVEQCNTSIPVMRKFLHCSLQNTETMNRHIVILFMSDETMEQYREEVAHIIDPFPHVSFLDMDNATRYIVKEAVEEGIIKRGLMEDNFFLYDVENVFTEFFLRKNELENSLQENIVLKKRRKTCPECFPIAQRRLRKKEINVQNRQMEQVSGDPQQEMWIKSFDVLSIVV